MRPADFLHFYADRLPSVELNNPFYELPPQERFEGWAASTPTGFRFAVKMSGRITHGGRLELARTFCERVRALGEKLGPVLVQLAPTRPRDDGFLRLVLDSLDPALAYAFELRHESWDVDETLFERGIARVGVLERGPAFRYLRLREPPYDEEALAALAERLRPVLAGGVDVYAYFKHEDEPTAPAYAAQLLELVRR
jgi:uncharacterized protein YecE (DUF72 family)